MCSVKIYVFKLHLMTFVSDNFFSTHNVSFGHTRGWGKQWTKVTAIITIPKWNTKTGKLHSTWMIIGNCVLKKGEGFFSRKHLEPEV